VTQSSSIHSSQAEEKKAKQRKMSSTDSILYEETFTLTAVDHKKYDRVARISATNSTGANDSLLTLDINTELFPLAPGDAVVVCIASTLALDGSKDDGRMWREISRGESTLADHYDYVAHGKVYKFEDGGEEEL
jgi:DNA-directed RNA polymerases I, II, and III subunit RPABC3